LAPRSLGIVMGYYLPAGVPQEHRAASPGIDPRAWSDALDLL
jgi:hypothetical protein